MFIKLRMPTDSERMEYLNNANSMPEFIFDGCVFNMNVDLVECVGVIYDIGVVIYGEDFPYFFRCNNANVVRALIENMSDLNSPHDLMDLGFECNADISECFD